MASGSTLWTDLDWDIDDDRRLAVAYAIHEGWLVMWAFGECGNGLIDLIGFRSEPCSVGGGRPLADRVQEIFEAWDLEQPVEGLTSRQLRVRAAGGPLLSTARAQLRAVVAPITWNSPVNTGRPAEFNDKFYAELAVAYDRELEAGPGARERLAERYYCGVNRIKDHLSESRRRGFRVTTGRGGTPGSATLKAYQLVEEGER